LRLKQLLADLQVLELRGDPGSVDITAIVEDSRRVVTGSLYCCVPGATVDGHDFAAVAVANGAAALLCERLLDLPVVQIRVSSSRQAMAAAAAGFYGRPSEHMQVIGVTGTNGKTTVAHMTASIFEAAGISAGVIGTLSGARTTPSAPVLQQLLAHERSVGRQAVAMEVSSHALDQGRVDSVRFAAAVFTNLSHDHLDYHGTMESYFRAKTLLFEPQRAGLSVVNLDDSWGRRLFGEIRAAKVGYSLADIAQLNLKLEGSSFRWRGHSVELALTGQFNVLNALAAATAATALGVAEEAVVEGLRRLAVIKGRMQPVELGQPFRVIVDFAHTPDGLERVLSTLRPVLAPGGRLAVVFGCGGERDPAKRPVMGALACRLADRAVLTSDNPRSEDPLTIISEVAAGAPDAQNLVIEPDRRSALAEALSWAGPGDVVVVAGKGHEAGQEIGGVTYPFDDLTVCTELLVEMGYGK
jgi:UDP-N-acetylmuramoyl-L-alanyl-D-glutamate--2,6-diaminopimelate ligase